mgnify:CR=1 FL=1
MNRIYEIEEGSGSVEGIQSGAKVTLPPQASLTAQNKITLNGGTLQVGNGSGGSLAVGSAVVIAVW